jgi:oligosaccharyltransferase complex subunit alpha (ribophorin I)
LFSQAYLFNVDLPTALDVNSTAKLVLETVQTHATRPWPEYAGQEEDQALKYETDLFVISPYPTTTQRSKIRYHHPDFSDGRHFVHDTYFPRSPSPRIISYTTPENMDQFTFDNVVTRSGATLTYGPYTNVPSSSKSPVGHYQKSIEIHYKYDQPVLEVTKLRRAAEISHWGANLNIQDEIYLHNAGPS